MARNSDMPVLQGFSALPEITPEAVERYMTANGIPRDPVSQAVQDYNRANPDSPITAQDILDKDRSGLFGHARLLGEGIFDAVTDQLPEDMARIVRGGDISPAQRGTTDEIIARQQRDSARRIPSLQEAQGDMLAKSLYQGPRSVATSMATGIGGMALGGAAGTVVPGVGTALGGMVGAGALSGAAFYRMAKDQFVEEVQRSHMARLGRPLSQEEAERLNAAIDDEATRFGLWEAGPEAVSQFFTAGLLGGAGGKILKGIGLGSVGEAVGKRAITRIPAKLGAEVGEEEVTEGITFMGQEGIRQDMGLRPDAPTVSEFIKEQAGPVAVGALLQMGGMRGAQYLKDRYTSRRQARELERQLAAAESAASEGTPPASPPPTVAPEDPETYERDFASMLRSPEWNAPDVPPDRESWNREARARGWNHLVEDDLAASQEATTAAPTVAPESPEVYERDFTSTLRSPEWNAPDVPPDRESWNREARARGWNHLVEDDFAASQSATTAGMAAGIGGLSSPVSPPPTVAPENPKIYERDFTSTLRSPEWNAPDVPPDRESWNREARARGWNHLVEDDFAASPGLQPSLDNGEHIDLLRGSPAPENGPSPSMPSTAGMAAGIGGLDPLHASPAADTLQETPLAAHGTPEISAPPAPLPPLPGVASGIGGLPFSPAQPAQRPPAQIPTLPTQAQLTRTQETPRADTTAAAERLGIPGPEAVPQEAQRPELSPAMPQQASSPIIPQQQDMPPQVVPVIRQNPNEPAQLQDTSSATNATSPVEEPRQTRIELLRQLPKELRSEARRMKTDEIQGLAEQQRAAEEPVPARQPEIESTKQENTAEEVEKHDEGSSAGRLERSDGRSGVEPPAGNAAGESSGRTGEGALQSAEDGNASEGKRQTRVKIPNRETEPATYALMEVEDVQPSHLPETDFERNPRYGLENERRYHDEPASKKKVLDNAANLDPDFLLESVDANHGAPVIDRKGNVLGGNGRTMSIRHAYEKFPDRAQRYRQALREHAEELGFSAADVDAMRRPILVRQLDNDYDAQTRQQLVSALNDTFTDSKNARTSGKSRGEHFSQKTLESLASGLSEADSLRQYFDLPESAQTVELLISDGVIKTTERNACLGADGLLNPDGKRIVEEALRGRIARTYEALATLPGPVVTKIDAVIPHLLIAENCGSKWDMTRHMRDAIDLLAEHKASGNIAPEIFLSQMDMFKGNTPRDRYSLAAQCLFQMVLGMKKKEFAKAVEGYANQAKISPEAGGIPGVAMKPEIAREAFFKIPRNEGGNKSAVTPENTGLPETEQPSAPEKQRSDHPSQSPGTFGTIDAPDTVALAAHFSEAFLSGKKFGAIIEARREAGSLLGGTVRPATEAAKAVDEAVELGVTLAARRTVAAMRERHTGDTEIYRALVDLYQRQPRLNVRTSTSIAQQAYSTPAPIAFLASRLAGIDSGTRVFEPTAGNGMLLLEASPDRAAVNELNPDRASRLRSQGFEVTERDAVDFRPEVPVDVVIANPPFGRVKGADRQTREFSVNGLTTKELDHAIVARALESLKQGGRAVLIIGGKQGNDASRSKKYRAADQVRFWGWLFERYRVLEHFCVDGKLYERQGAGYPIDVIVLENSGTSAGRPFPGAALPRVYTSFNALEEVLHGQVVDTAERKSGSDGTDTGRTGDGANQQRGRSDRPADAAGSEADRGSVRSGGNAGADGARSGERLDSKEEQNIRVNDIASAYRRGNERWYLQQIEEGRLLYQDKKKSLAWARTKGLQLPKVRKLPARLSGKRILNENDVVKPVAPADEAPLASLRSPDTSWRERVAAAVRGLRNIAGRGVSEDVQALLDTPEQGRLIPREDLGRMERLLKLPHWVAKDHPQFATIYNRQLRRVDERRSAVLAATRRAPLLFDADAGKRLNADEERQLGEMIWKWDGREPDALRGVEKFTVTGTSLNHRAILELNPRYQEKFRAWLREQPEPERVKEAFAQVRALLDESFLHAYGRMTQMADLADTDLELFRTEMGNLPNYFPHQRKGKYYVEATTGRGIIGDPRKLVYRQHFDVPLGSSVREEWAKIVAANEKDYPGATWHNPKEVVQLPDDILGAPLDPQALEQLINTTIQRQIKDGEQAEEVRKALLSGLADVLKARGFGAHAIQRKNIPGFDRDDIKGILYNYISGLHGWLSKMDASADFAQALGKISAQKSPELWSFASQYVKDMLRNADSIDRIAGNIKTAAFVWYLGGNIKTAVVNSTQNLIVGVPRLQQEVTGGGALWLKAAMDTLGLRFSGRGIAGAKALKADELRMLEELYGAGVIADAHMDEIRGQMARSPALRMWERLVRVLGMPMSIVEHFNRASLALAAYRAARAGRLSTSACQRLGVREGARLNHDMARDFADMLVRDTHFEYGKGNAPELLRSTTAGRMLSPAFVFRSFSGNIINLWWRALRHEGREGRVFVAKSLGATVALGGLTAFPFYATLSALCTALSGDDEDWTTKVRRRLPESNLFRDVVCYGLPSLAGVTIGGSLRMETPFTEGIEKGTTFKEIMTQSLVSLIGVPYDLAVNKVSRALEAHSYGADDRALEALVPTFMANIMQARRLATEGQTTLRGRPINSPGQQGARKLDAYEAFGKALGFQPTSSARSYAAYKADKLRSATRSDRIDDFTNLALRDLESNGHAYMLRELRKRLQTWNAEMEEEGKTAMRIMPKEVLRRVTARRRENRPSREQRAKGAAQMALWGV